MIYKIMLSGEFSKYIFLSLDLCYVEALFVIVRC